MQFNFIYGYLDDTMDFFDVWVLEDLRGQDCGVFLVVSFLGGK